jgi:anti-sigma B factor antagonist
MRTLTVEIRWDGDEASVSLVGELDLSTAAQVESALAEAEEKAPARLELDLRGLTFMDSTGLRVVLAADGRARKEGRRLEVVPGPPQVHRVFRIALLDRRIVFVDPPEDDPFGPDGGADGSRAEMDGSAGRGGSAVGTDGSAGRGGPAGSTDGSAADADADASARDDGGRS